MTNDEIIMNKLESIQRGVIAIQEYLEDTQLTEEDLVALGDAEEEYCEGETISSDDLKKEIGLDVQN